MDAVSARAGVTKMTVYRYYPSKDHLVLAFLRRREELWTRAWLQRQFWNSVGRMVYPDLSLWDREMGYIATSLWESSLNQAGGMLSHQDSRRCASRRN